MRADYEREKPRVLPWLLGLIAVVFVLELVLFSPWFNWQQPILNYIPLSIAGLKQWHLWTFLSYGLLQDLSLFQIIFVLAGLYLLGRELETLLGARRFLTVFLGSLLFGGLAWTAVNWQHGGSLIGAMPGLYGLLVVYACIYPDEPFRLLLLFIFPVTITPRQLVLILLSVDLFAFFLYEIMGSTMPFAYAPSAHLGGMAAGWLCHRFWRAADDGLGGRRFAFTLPRWLKRTRKPTLASSANSSASSSSAAATTTKSNRTRSADLRTEVDRILDKINSDGFGALTPAEKRVLDEAKDLLSRR